MKCASFLLALCAFETAFAIEDLEVRLGRLHQHYTDQMKVIVSSFRILAEAQVLKGQDRNVQSNQCMGEYHELQRYSEAIITRCNDCYTYGIRHGNPQAAEPCYLHHFRSLNSDAARRLQEIAICINAILHGKTYTMRPAPLMGPSNLLTRK